MKTLSPALAAHLTGEVTSLSTCWRIERRDGAVLRFTDADAPLVVEGETYLVGSAFTRSAVASEAGLAPDHLDVVGLIDAAALDEGELRAGLFDHAEVRLFVVDREAPEAGVLKLRRGRIGEVELAEDGTFRAELRGLAQALSQAIGELCSPECRADLGDARCKVLVTGPDWRRAGAVTGVVSRLSFDAVVADASAEPGFYAGGVLLWTSGENAGVASEVKRRDAATGRIELWQAPPLAVGTGDGFALHPGCDKRFATCRTKFANHLNFRGEPHVPGLDAVTRVASGRTARPAEDTSPTPETEFEG